ncbi:MAG: sulfotransferase [Candidatus Caenarcaniphilales bacterium]|nr:sulfotransferase [Candidatus Caenarcaniphilales bacterium]
MPKLLFIGGLHRSGTSLIHKAIAEHPDISGFSDTEVPEDEGQHLQTIYPKASFYGGPGKFGFDSESALDESSSLITPTNAERIFKQWSDYWDLSKAVLVEKSPPNLTKTRFLQALFPESYFLIIMRHPVVVSYATKKWSQTSLYSLLRHWVICHERFEADRPFLERCMVIRYEDFVKDLSKSLNQVFEFVGVSPFDSSFQASEAHNQKYYQRWEKLGKIPLVSFYRQFLIRSFEEEIQKFGYSFCDLP